MSRKFEMDLEVASLAEINGLNPLSEHDRELLEKLVELLSKRIKNKKEKKS